MKLAALAGIMVLATSYLSAQEYPDTYYSPWTFGMRVGVNASPAVIKYSGDYTDKKNIWGFQAGFSAEYAFGRPFFVESGIYFTSKGGALFQNATLNGTPVDVRTEHAYNPSYALIPLKLGISLFPANPRNDIKLKAGFYAAYGIGGNYSVETLYGDDRDDIKTTAGVFNALERFDCGLDLGVDFEISNLTLGIGYQLGLIDIAKQHDAFSEFRNSTFSATIGYKFYF